MLPCDTNGTLSSGYFEGTSRRPGLHFCCPVTQTVAVRVLTNTGKRFRIWSWTDKELYNLSYYPLRPGYCSTIIKFQGAELKHVTVYLDVPGVPGAAYTAMSRVATANQYLIGGNVNPHHFTPRQAAFTRTFTSRRISY